MRRAGSKMLSIKVDINGALASLQNVRSDQIPYVTSRAINDCADKAVDDLVKWVQTIFNFRGSGAWVRYKWFESKWSSKYNLVALVIGKLDYLLLHETGGIKTPHMGMSLAVPLGTLRLKRIPPQLRPKYVLGSDMGGLLRSASLGPRSRKKQIANFGKGFILELGGKRFIVMRTTQNIGVAAKSARLNGLQMLYYLTPAVKIVPRLRMHESVERTVVREFNAAFARRMNEAIATSR